MTGIESTETKRPPWLDPTIFPFLNRQIEISGHKIHYIDEGTGPILLMLHGNGSWSYGFRLVIPALSKHFRVIALDYPGFGLSTAGAGYSFKPIDHSSVVESFVDALGLREIRLFCEDWGGPIGLGLAVRRADLIFSLALTNTWAWPPQRIVSLEKFSGLAGGAVGSFLITRCNLMTRYMLPAMAIARTMTPAEKQGYWMPYPTPESRVPQTIFPREILASRAYLSEVETGLGRLKEKPVSIIWGQKDPGFTEDERERWLDHFPRASVVVLPEAKHFVTVDEPERCIGAILEFENVQVGM